MSRTGTMVDELEALFRGVVGDLPAGALGWERLQGDPGRLDTDQRPHVFAHSPTREFGKEPYGQRAVTYSVQLDYWRWDQTQEQMLVELEAFSAALNNAQRLDGSFTGARVVRDHVVEWVERQERAAVIVVLAEDTD